MFKLGFTSKQRLEGVHPHLVSVVERAIQLTEQDFSVICGRRTRKEQEALVKSGASQTMNSRHLTGHAVDLAPYPLNWDWDNFFPIADSMIQASKELNIPIRWGGNWEFKDIRHWPSSAKELNEGYSGKFPDGPHFELSRAYYS